MVESQQIEEIRNLHPTVRIAGYLARIAVVAEYGARLRTTKEDDGAWSPEEESEWYSLIDKVDPWFYALTPQERELFINLGVTELIGRITRGEDLL